MFYKNIKFIALLLLLAKEGFAASYYYYQLLNGDKVAHCGYTTNLSTAVTIHQNQGYKFDSMNYVGSLTYDEATELAQVCNEIHADTYTYVLISKNKVIYCGITNNPKRRVNEHRRDGKIFDYLQVTSSKPMIRQEARLSEKICMCTYGKKHTCLPYLNKIH